MTISPSPNAWPSSNFTCNLSGIMKTRKRSLDFRPPERQPARQPARQPLLPAANSWKWYAIPLGVLALLFWAYGPALHTGFLFDDSAQQFAMPTASVPLSGWIGPVRPVLMFTYWLNTRISLDDTSSYH